MPLAFPHAPAGGRLTRARRIIAPLPLLLCCAALSARAPAHKPPAPISSPYDNALRMREALNGQPQRERTRRDYDRVLSAFRAVYHDAPRSAHADASVAVVAELLAEQGRIFQTPRASQDSIGQYEFLRRAYPASSYRYSALLTEGEIYSRDLNDPVAARTIFAEFLKLYPQNALADQARQELKRMPVKARSSSAESRGHPAQAASAAPETGQSAHSRHNSVLDAAIASQKPRPIQAGPARRPGIAPQPLAITQGKAAAPPPRGTAPGGDTLVESDLPSKSNASLPADAAALALRSGQEPPPATTLSEAALNAPPPAPRRGKLPLVTGVRHWSTAVYTRVAIDLESEVRYEASRVPNPDRIFFDLHGARLSPELVGKAVSVTDGGYLKRVRAAQFSNDMVRIVLDVSDVSDYSAFLLPNPSRLIIDIHGKAPGQGSAVAASNLPGQGAAAASRKNPQTAVLATPAVPVQRTPAPHGSLPTPLHPHTQDTNALALQKSVPQPVPSDTLGDIATLDRQPNTIRATRRPTTEPVAASVANTTPAPQPGLTPRHTSSSAGRASAHGATPAETLAPAIHAPDPKPFMPIHAAVPTAAGERSMVRALGLKIGRIVVDAGHGGHDSGTLGPGGIEEKEVVLDVALRLGRLLKQRLGADVIYTRDDDTFIPLETRTAIANKAQADLFLSVHANSSPDASARGVETYYLNFTSSADALEVAARENAVSDHSIHQLSDLVRKITLQDKISESREFAGDVEQTLYSGLEAGNPGLKDRGVKKAPFVVLIGANMPSILAEISFLTNPDDAHQLRDPEYRQRIAESLYRGVAKYIGSLSGVRLAESAGRPAGQ